MTTQAEQNRINQATHRESIKKRGLKYARVLIPDNPDAARSIQAAGQMLREKYGKAD